MEKLNEVSFVNDVLHDEVSIKSTKDIEVLDITEKVKEWISKNGAQDGILTAFSTHTTAGLTINEAESGLMNDIALQLSKLCPPHAGYYHDRIDDNAHSHLMTSILSPSETVIVKSGQLALGTWQRILFVECDGPRRRRVLLTFTGKFSG
jgi:secondary thiamine-phosphate synthase enzyme